MRIFENCDSCGGHNRPTGKNFHLSPSVLVNKDQMERFKKEENSEKMASILGVNVLEQTTLNKNRKINGPWRCSCE